MEIEKLSEKIYMVHSDSGKMYKVRLTGEKASTISCECVGFRHRRKCKHVEAVKGILTTEGKAVRTQARPRDTFDYILPYKTAMAEFLNMKCIEDKWTIF